MIAALGRCARELPPSPGHQKHPAEHNGRCADRTQDPLPREEPQQKLGEERCADVAEIGPQFVDRQRRAPGALPRILRQHGDARWEVQAGTHAEHQQLGADPEEGGSEGNCEQRRSERDARHGDGGTVAEPASHMAREKQTQTGPDGQEEVQCPRPAMP